MESSNGKAQDRGTYPREACAVEKSAQRENADEIVIVCGYDGGEGIAVCEDARSYAAAGGEDKIGRG